MLCKFCGVEMHPERPYDYCLDDDCYRQGFEKPRFVVVGQHKGPPLVIAANDPIVVERQNTMRRS